jgi:prolyl oligopeptidase
MRLLQPNLLSEDGTAALSTLAFSDKGRYMAYGISRSVRVHTFKSTSVSILKLCEQGSDWVNIYVRPGNTPHKADQPKGRDEGRLDDVVRFVKFSSISWTKDEKGLFLFFPNLQIRMATLVLTFEAGFFYQRYPEHDDHGSHDDDKAGTGTGMDVNAMVRLVRRNFNITVF